MTTSKDDSVRPVVAGLLLRRGRNGLVFSIFQAANRCRILPGTYGRALATTGTLATCPTLMGWRAHHERLGMKTAAKKACAGRSALRAGPDHFSQEKFGDRSKKAGSPGRHSRQRMKKPPA